MGYAVTDNIHAVSTSKDAESLQKDIENLRCNLEAHADVIKKSIQEADRLCAEEADRLTPEQFHALKNRRNQLESTYSHLLQHSDVLLEKLNEITRLLLDFTSCSSAFQSYITGATREISSIKAESGNLEMLNESIQRAELLEKDVHLNGEQLRNISALLHHVRKALDDYVVEFHVQYQDVEITTLDAPELSDTLSRIQTDYEILSRGCSDLRVFLKRLSSLSDFHNQNVARFNNEISRFEQLLRVATEKVASAGEVSDNAIASEILFELEGLQAMSFEQAGHLDAIMKSAAELEEALIGTDARERIVLENKQLLDDYKRRQNRAREKIEESVDSWRSKLARSEGLREGITGLVDWLKNEEERLKHAPQLPLSLDQLSELRNEGELAHRELMSRQKVLETFEKEIFRISGLNPNSAPNSQLVEQYRKAENMFLPLILVSQAFCENTAELCNLLSAANDGEKLLRDKLSALERRMETVSPTNEEEIESVRGSLDQVSNKDWADLRELQERILKMPNVVETEQFEHSMNNIHHDIENMYIKLGKVAAHCKELLRLKENYNKQRNAILSWLNSVKSKFDELEKTSLNELKLSAQHNICEELQNEHREWELELDKFRKVGSELVELESIARICVKNPGECEESHAKLQEISVIVQQYNSLGIQLKKKSDKIGLISGKLADWYASKNGLVQWAAQEARLLDAKCSIALSQSDLLSNSTRISRLEKVMQKEKEPLLEKIKAKARTLLSDTSVTDSDEILVAQKDLEKAWESLKHTIDLVKGQVDISKQLLQGREDLDKWLKQKERMLAVIEEAVNADPKVIGGQIFQIELLLSEMVDQEDARSKMNNSANILISNADETSRQQIIEKMDEFNLRWMAFSNKLKDDEHKLTDAKEATMQFAALQRSIRSALLELAEEVEETSRHSLTAAEHFDEHLQKLDSLKEKSINISGKMGELRKSASSIIYLIPGVQSEVTEQLNSALKFTEELNKKIESLKNAALNAKKLENETVKEVENTFKWLKGLKTQLNDVGNVSADPLVLAEQSKIIEELYTEALSKEGDIAFLRAKLNEQLKKGFNEQLKARSDALYVEWVPALEEVKKKHAATERVSSLVKQLEDALEAFEQRAINSQERLRKLPTSEPNIAKELGQQIERSFMELQSLEPIMAKLEEAVGGKSATILKRRLDNAHNDWKVIVKDVRGALAKQQIKKELKIKFDKCKSEAAALLNSVHEIAFPSQNEASTIGGIADKDAILKAISDLKVGWNKQSNELMGTVEELQTMLEPDEEDELKSMICSLESYYGDLLSHMENNLHEISEKEKQADHLKNEVSEIGCSVRSLAVGLKPVDPSRLEEQRLECEALLQALGKKEKDLSELSTELRDHCSGGVITTAQLTFALNQLAATREDIASQKKMILHRENQISDMRQSISKITEEVDFICVELKKMLKEEVLEGLLNLDLSDLKSRQEELRLFRDKLRKRIGERVEKAINECDRLVKATDKQADVSVIETEKVKVLAAWNEICNIVTEREKHICASIQELGSFADAYNALLIWLEDTEESLDNQQPPSTEYKVVKAQSSASDILLKHIEEKQTSVEKLKALMEKLAADESQRFLIKDKSENFAQRYGVLLERAQTRRIQLHAALELAEQWSHITIPLLGWLDDTEKSVQQLGKVPVNEEVMQQQIGVHQSLQRNIVSKREDFDRLPGLCQKLIELTSKKEAEELENFMNGLLSRYQDLESRTDQCGTLLKQLAEDIGSFLEQTSALSDWLDKMEDDINKIRDISIYPEELFDQSSVLSELATEVTSQELLVTNVVENGRDLCRHTSGDEAIVLQSRIEGLRSRYLELTANTDNKIALLSEALPLAEKFQNGCESIQQWMDAVEQDLQDIDQVPLEAQSALVAQMEDDLNKWQIDVGDLNSISKQLMQLSGEPRADELDAQTDELNRRFSMLAEQVTQKAERLSSAEKQSRQVLDELDYLNGWFADAVDRLKQASAPAVDPDYVKKQLRNQKLMNEDIAVMRARLRDAVADAQKVARALGDEADGQNALLASRIESGRELSAEVTHLGEKRLGDLEQALALCQEVELSFGELYAWLGNIESEIETCLTNLNTGIQRDELLKQQALNAELQQLIQSQKPLLDRFERNVAALGELCDEEDALKLDKIAEGLEERYEEVRNVVKNRSLVLDNAIEHSSQFTDRLDVMLSKLGGAAAQIRNPDPVSSDPERIRSQISENLALKDELRVKEGALKSVKESADAILKQAKPNDPAVAEISLKIDKLDALWRELNDGVTQRENTLESTLAKAERFWSELEKCQNAIEELRTKIMDIHPAAGQRTVIQQQQETLLAIENDLHQTEPMVNELRSTGRDLCGAVAREERAHVEQQLEVVEGNWSTVTDLYVRKNKDLIDAMDNAMEFHGLYSELLEWLVERENKMAEFSQSFGLSCTDVRNELAALDVLKTVLDEKVVQKERLNQLCANLCVGATVQQCAAIRAPINELNTRWNKLYAALSERQQKLEKAFLEMGQFSQAFDQLLGWIDKTNHTLAEIAPRPTSVKQVEIEVCKYKVVQNDIRAHEASVETLNTAAKRLMITDPNSASATQQKIDELNAQWHMLADKLDNLWAQLTGAREAAESLGDEMDKWTLWLQDKDADLSHSRPLAGLPETARAQLDDFLVLKAEIEQNRPELESHLEAGDKYLSGNVANKDTWVAQKQMQLRKKWTQIQEKLVDKEQKLQIALTDAEELSGAMNEMNEWLGSAEATLGKLEPVSRIPSTLQKQINEQTKFETEVTKQRDLMTDLKSRGTKLQYLCEKKDAIPIKNGIVSARHRLDKIVSRCTDRGKQLDTASRDSKLYFDSHTDLMDWIDNSLQWIETNKAKTLFIENIREALNRHKNFHRELDNRQQVFDATSKRGKTLMDHAPKNEQAILGNMNEELHKQWFRLCAASVQRQRDIEEALLESGQFDDALSSLREWLEKTLPVVETQDSEPVYGDLETVKQFIEENQVLKDEISSHQTSLNSVRQRAEQMLNIRNKDENSSEGLRDKLNQLNADWQRLGSLVDKRHDRLCTALQEAEAFGSEARAILDSLPRIEDRLRMKGQRAETEAEILDQMDEVAQVRKDLDDKVPRLEKVLASGQEILKKCHPNAEQNMKYWLKVLRARWDEVSLIADAKRSDLEKQLSNLHKQEELIDALLKFINAKDADLKAVSNNELPFDSSEIQKLIDEHEQFDNSLRTKQTEVSNATVGRRLHVMDPDATGKHKKSILKKEKPIRHPKADLLSEKWNRLWLDSVEYSSRLRKMKEHLKELKKLELFTFEEWRERYLEWTDSGKARISDLFRRIDKSGAGRVPRNAFIDEILRSKFPTTRMEMEKVADEFDKGDGMIDSKEFMARLRSEYAKKFPVKPKTEGEKINEEVQRQNEKCSCHTPYKIQEAGEGHYRFGDAQIKRMVRILRFTVMVRVGGGWVALDEFLQKHDPCRAKGRTNIDLQRGFYNDVRPLNAHDSIETFTKSRLGSNRASPITVAGDIGHYNRYAATPGPIAKIREKTERSVPMHSGKHTPSSSQISLNEVVLPQRTSDESMQDGKMNRNAVLNSISRSNSRGEISEFPRPSSRCSECSDLSEKPTRIPSLRGRKGVNYRPSSARNSPHP